MGTVRDELGRVLAANELQAPDGRALYAYLVSDDQLEALRALLKRQGHRASRFDRFEAAAFCLHAAFAFCERHVDGSWAWATVTDPLGIEAVQSVVAELTEEGLGWWRRRVLPVNDRQHFLVTLACEGGLPQSLIVRDRAHLRTFYARLLADRERYPGTAIEALIGRHEHLLPQTLRNAVVQELSGALVDRIAALRKVVARADNPVEALDAAEPGWRAQIPLRLRDDVALEMLRGLLAQPGAPRTAGTEIVVASFVRETPSGWVIVREADVPPVMSANDLASQLGVSSDALPLGFVLHLRTSDGASHRVAIATRLASSDDDAEYRLEATGGPLTAEGKLGALGLVAISNAREIGAGIPRGGERIEGLPWVFAAAPDADGRFPLIGVGGVQTCRPAVLVAMPDSMTLSSRNPIQELGHFVAQRRVPPTSGASSAPSPFASYKVCRLHGRATLGSEDEVLYVIQTGAELEVGRTAVLRGERLPLGNAGSEAWAGVPHVEIREGTVASRVAPRDLEWRTVPARSAWRAMSADCLGDVELRLQRRGETLARFRTTILPANTRVSLRPGTKHGRGTVVVEGAGVRKVEAGIGAGVTGEAIARDGKAEVELVAAEGLPAAVPLWLELDGGRRATIEVPFPAVAALFVDAGGNVMPAGAAVAVDSLLGMRVQVVAPSPSERCELTACLFGNPRGAADDAVHLENLHASRRDLAHLTRDALGRHVLVLDDVRDAVRQLLAMSTDLDAYVELRVELLGGSPTPATRRELHVKRYDAWFEPARTDGARWIDIPPQVVAVVGREALERIRVEAFPICLPDASRVALERVDERWKMDLTGKAAGPWFVLGIEGTDVRFRPLLVTIDGDETGPLSPMRVAMNIGAKGARRRALDGSIAALAQDVRDADWPLMWHMLRQLEDLPAATYDPVDRLVRNLDAVAVTALSASSAVFTVLFRKLQELPFMWALVPVRSWFRAMDVVRRSYESKAEALAEIPGGWHGLFEQRLTERFAQFQARASWFQNVWDAAVHFMPDLRAHPSRPVEAVRAGQSLVGLIGFKRNEMRCRHAEDDAYPRANLSEALARVPRDVREVLAHRSAPARGFETDAFNAPLIAAAAAVFGHDIGRPTLFDIARMRDFDRYGFDELYELLVAQILGQQIGRKGEQFDDQHA